MPQRKLRQSDKTPTITLGKGNLAPNNSIFSLANNIVVLSERERATLNEYFFIQKQASSK